MAEWDRVHPSAASLKRRADPMAAVPRRHSSRLLASMEYANKHVMNDGDDDVTALVKAMEAVVLAKARRAGDEVTLAQAIAGLRSTWLYRATEEGVFEQTAEDAADGDEFKKITYDPTTLKFTRRHEQAAARDDTATEHKQETAQEQ